MEHGNHHLATVSAKFTELYPSGVVNASAGIDIEVTEQEATSQSITDFSEKRWPDLSSEVFALEFQDEETSGKFLASGNWLLIIAITICLAVLHLLGINPADLSDIIDGLNIINVEISVRRNP
jgi:hypothetical protein